RQNTRGTARINKMIDICQSNKKDKWQEQMFLDQLLIKETSNKACKKRASANNQGRDSYPVFQHKHGREIPRQWITGAFVCKIEIIRRVTHIYCVYHFFE